MFSLKRHFFVLFGLFVSVALATDYVFTGDFTETRSNVPNATTTGKFYYLYSTNGAAKCRFRVNYDSVGVENLYHYLYDSTQQKSVLYSMCDECTAESIFEMPDKWWYDSTVYTKTDMMETVSDQEMYWYTRNNQDKSSMVSAILMTEAAPESTKVGAITFYDGRTFRITNYKRDASLTASSSQFKTKSGVTCPTPTCSMFADIAFVLDYSGTVSSAEWRQTSDFAIGVMNSLSFGDHAAAAACIQFNAPDSFTEGETGRVACNAGSPSSVNRYLTDCTYPESACTEARTASVLAGADTSSGMTVSSNKQDLITAMSMNRTPSGASPSCLGFGLELAMKVFDRSPRANTQKIVVVVTDNANPCPIKTQAAANKLRDQYGAFIVGIGVGLPCNYDDDFIENLTSTVGSLNDKAYLSVPDYSKINNIVNSLSSILCELFSSGCGPACKGFWGCGKCFCPTCNASSNMCEILSCIARDGTSNGCVATNKNCRESESSKCIIYYCNSSDGQCKESDTCEATKQQHPYACQNVTCNPADGTCPVAFDDDFCRLKHKNDLGVWSCAREGEIPDDGIFGCVNSDGSNSSELNHSGSSSDKSSAKGDLKSKVVVVVQLEPTPIAEINITQLILRLAQAFGISEEDISAELETNQNLEVVAIRFYVNDMKTAEDVVEEVNEMSKDQGSCNQTGVCRVVHVSIINPPAHDLSSASSMNFIMTISVLVLLFALFANLS